MFTASLLSPIGAIIVTADEEQLLAIRLGGTAVRSTAPAQEPDGPLLAEAVGQLQAWFDHRLKIFDLPLAQSRTARGAELREAICSIGYGDTASYGEVARKASSGPRAIGQACRRNPFPIIVPCHRVLGAAQAIGHYSGGDGVETKRWLLLHEHNTLI